MSGIYFHIPFCKRICAYCDFFRSADLGSMPQTLEAMHRELDARRDYLHDRRIRTVYFGGGTPSLCKPETFRSLIGHAAALHDCSNLEEVTAEVNPDDLTDSYLAALREAGIDRLSIGIQSFDDDCLRLMNRRHTAAQAEEAVRAARRAGFTNLTVDLIFGVPGFGGESLKRSLERTLALEVPHVSAYHLTVEPQTAFGRMAARGAFRPVNEHVSEAEFLEVHRTLAAAGFEHYEVSNFARPGYRAIHNASYWSGAEYLGIGPGAHSYDGYGRHWTAGSIAKYLDGFAYECETLSETDRWNEYLMTSLRTAEGVDTSHIAVRFGEKRLLRMLAEARRYLDAGLLRRIGTRLAVPAERFLVSDEVIGALFETEPAP